jgi:hypothetical protein
MSVQHFDGSVATLERLEDDVRAIRKKCKTHEHWQEQILRSLIDAGWIYSMLVWLPACNMLHWVELLHDERDKRRAAFDPSFERENYGTEQAHKACTKDREQWFRFALMDLARRGWSRTMLAAAFGEPRTNIIRRLERQDGRIASPELIADFQNRERIRKRSDADENEEF